MDTEVVGIGVGADALGLVSLLQQMSKGAQCDVVYRPDSSQLRECHQQ